MTTLNDFGQLHDFVSPGANPVMWNLPLSPGCSVQMNCRTGGDNSSIGDTAHQDKNILVRSNV